MVGESDVIARLQTENSSADTHPFSLWVPESFGKPDSSWLAVLPIGVNELHGPGEDVR